MNLIAEVPIFPLCVDGGASCVQACRVTTLHHEILDDAVEEDVVVVAVAGVHREVLHRPGALLSKQLHVNVPHRRANNRRFPQLLLYVDMCHCGCMCVCVCVCVCLCVW